MKKVIYILLVLIACGCEMPPEHLFGIHFHAYKLNIYNQYADGDLLVRSYYLHKECDTCELDTILGPKYNIGSSFLYNESTCILFETPIDFAIQLAPYDSTINIYTWYLYIGTGERNKHTDIMLE